MAYAEGTSVPIEKSMSEIVALIKKAGAQRVGQVEEPESIAVQFFMRDRMLRFRVRLTQPSEIPERMGNGQHRTAGQRRERAGQRSKQRVRALLLVIKAKLESVESEVETFEEAFLANVVMSDGATLYERVREPIAVEYQAGKPHPMLLEAPR